MGNKDKSKRGFANNLRLPNPYNGVEYPNTPIDSIEDFKQYFYEVTKNEILPPCKKFFCVMLFYEESDITCNPQDDGKWINTKNVYFHNGTLALDYYANTPCPASQLIDGETLEQLVEERNKMLLNFKDEKFLEKLYESI